MHGLRPLSRPRKAGHFWSPAQVGACARGRGSESGYGAHPMQCATCCLDFRSWTRPPCPEAGDWSLRRTRSPTHPDSSVPTLSETEAGRYLLDPVAFLQNVPDVPKLHLHAALADIAQVEAHRRHHFLGELPVGKHVHQGCLARTLQAHDAHLKVAGKEQGSQPVQDRLQERCHGYPSLFPHCTILQGR